MIGVIDVGGGLRGIYGAGVFDYCLDHNIHFDYCIGASAGSANIISYAAGQRGRNYNYYFDYCFRKESMSIRNFIKKRSYLDMDYIYSTLYNSDGELPLDYPAVKRSGLPLLIVATSAITGKTVYFTQDDLQQDQYNIIKASCSIPVLNRPYVIHGTPYYDGGISNPIPVEKAFEDGCDRVVIILTKPLDDQVEKSRAESFFSHFIDRKFPQVAELMRHHTELYREQLRTAKRYEAEGKALIIAPKTIYHMRTLTKDKAVLQKLYNDALESARLITSFVADSSFHDDR